MKTDGRDGESVSGGEEAPQAARRHKAQQVRARGGNPFANDVRTVDRVLVRELREKFSGAVLEPPQELRYDPEAVARIAASAPARVLGRLVARRGFGKAAFFGLRDATGDIQIFAGVDRLAMTPLGQHSIRDVIAFPLLRPESGHP